MICPNCSNSNPDGAKFCNECGMPLDPSKSRAASSDPSDTARPTSEVPTASLPRVKSLRTARHAAATVAASLAEDSISEYPTESIDYAPSHAAAFPDAFEYDLPENDPLSYIPDPFDASYPSSTAPTQELPSSDSGSQRGGWNIDATLQMPVVFDDPDSGVADSEIYSAPEPGADTGTSKPRRKGLMILLAIIVLAGAIAGVTYFFELWGGIRVPNVVGMNESEALNVLQEKGFSVRSMQVKSDDTEGKVILSDPKSGDRARKGGEVVIHVATPRTIPDIVGKSEEEAKKLLSESGYENVTIQKVKSNDDEGKVLSVSPEAGTKVKGATPVTVTVAEPYTVPNVVGMDEQSAIAAVQDAGYYVSIEYDYTEGAPEGQVVSTSPEADSKYPSESTVTIRVTKSRAHELTDIMHGILYDGATAYIGGTSYYIHSVESIEYVGDDVVNFSVVGQAYTVLDGETVYGSTKTITGSAHFDASNNYTLN
ncbi:MAG: PASTA domain-containing protein [Eggerthellaceae bacterium]|nr:PASTA domain-containing protein [Eggerthellaceae bacterium]